MKRGTTKRKRTGTSVWLTLDLLAIIDPVMEARHKDEMRQYGKRRTSRSDINREAVLLWARINNHKPRKVGPEPEEDAR